MVQIMQQGPSAATLRQQALDEALGNVMGGIGNYQKQQQTLRQQALQEQALAREQENQNLTQTLKLQEMGIASPLADVKAYAQGTYQPKVVQAQEAVPAQYGAELAGPPAPGQGTLRQLLSPAKEAVQGSVGPANPMQVYTPMKQAEMAKKSQDETIQRQLKEAQLRKLIQDESMSPLARRKAEEEIKNIQARTSGEYLRSQNELGSNKLEKKIIETQAVDTAKSVSGLSKVKSAMDNALKVLEDPTTSNDQKIKTGQGLFKLLNSAEGSDAVGAEEARRIGSFLEFNLANFTQPGAFFGRDVEGFVDQIKNYSSLLGERVKSGNEALRGLKSGTLIGQETQQVAKKEAPQSIEHVKSTMTRQEMIDSIRGAGINKTGAR